MLLIASGLLLVSQLENQLPETVPETGEQQPNSSDCRTLWYAFCKSAVVKFTAMIKKLITLTAVVLGLSLPGFAQQLTYLGGDEEGRPVYQVNDVAITAKAPSKAKKRRYEKRVRKFNKLRYNIVKVLPYANEASKNLKEINEAMATVPEEELNSWLKTKEKDLFGEYEDDIRNMTHSQGKILIKLIDRQCGVSTYYLVKDLKSGAAAFFWQGIGRVFGYNLKATYDPQEDDRDVEYIVKSIESGKNPTYFDMMVEYYEVN